MVVVASALLDPHRLGNGDLDVIDVPPVPDRLENSVCETERHDVLDGLFAEIVIDTVNLRLVDYFQELLVQRLGRLEVVAEGLFNDHAPPVVILLAHQADRT